jgi:hypothetical protein
MGQPVDIARLEYSASGRRVIAVKMKDAAVARRLLALALVLEGSSREAAANTDAMNEHLKEISIRWRPERTRCRCATVRDGTSAAGN